MSRLLPEATPAARMSGLGGYVFATVMALLALGVAFAAARYLAVANLSLILLVAVLIVATRASMAVAIYAALLCFVGYNFFFTRPYYTLTITYADDLVTVLLFLVVALICSRLATQLSNKVESLRLAQQRAAAVMQLGHQLAGGNNATTIRQLGAQALAHSVGAQVVMLERDATRSLRCVLSVPSGIVLSPEEIAAASWNAGPRYPGSQTDAAGYWVIPLELDMHDHGVAALLLDQQSAERDEDRRALALAMCQDIALALERVRLADALEHSRVQAETERLRNALLASVSHDLRSPLASIIGSAETLTAYGQHLPQDERLQLTAGIVQEGQRLDRYIQNLLDMARLGHGTLALQRDWVDASEVVLAAVARLRRFFPAQAIATALPDETLLLHVHPALIEQALFNVLENAAHFSPPDQPVRIEVTALDQQLQIDVIDRGPGIPEDERARIFDMFHSVSRGDRNTHGTGLGLTICHGMVGAHGGTVEALPGNHDGTTIRIRLPLPPAPETAP